MEKAIEVRAWSNYINKIREFFVARGFTEVFTPSLVATGAFESSLDCLKVSFSTGELELHTSPEIEMKACLAETKLPIFQICKSYRDDPPTPIHSREFTMLEYYRPEVDYLTTRQDMKELLNHVAGRSLAFEEISVRELALKSTGLDLEKLSTTELLHAAIAKVRIIETSPDDTWDDLFFKLLLEKWEPALHPTRPTILHDYPPSQSALAAINPKTGWAERFEIYWRGVELCNGCTELTDIGELDRRYEKEKSLREKQRKVPHAYPQRLASAMRNMPPASGVAVGLDRLFRIVRSN